MSLATVRSCALAGVTALPVTVEVHLGGGLPGMAIVGLPQSAVRESKDRVKAAIRHAGLQFPKVKVIVNLAPADLPKRGGRFDLPIALGILIASGQLPETATAGLVVVGELGLGGELRAVEGSLSAARACRDAGDGLLVPTANLAEAVRCPEVRVCGFGTLADAVVALGREGALPFSTPLEQAVDDTEASAGASAGSAAFRVPDLADVVGQHAARRALEIAAAGGHNLLFCGPPGTGKSMLASRLPGILPPMDEGEAGESASVASVSHAGFEPSTWGVRPFRAPHHTVSGIALVGGGSPPMPGEISLAHNGVLFLDELAEFKRPVLDVLREPLESGRIALSRAARQTEFPARFQLVAAMNPCPCGRYGDGTNACRCSLDVFTNYRGRLSGPFLDRIDLHVSLQREALPASALGLANEDDRDDVVPAESSATVRERVCIARHRQLARQGRANAHLASDELLRLARLQPAARACLEEASSALELSLRVVHRTLALARTIADLAGASEVAVAHATEAMGYRQRPVALPEARWDARAAASV